MRDHTPATSRTLLAMAVTVCWLGVIVPGCGDDDAGTDNDNNGNSSARCGDGVVDDIEDCDDGDDNSDTLPDACRTDCQFAHCGDGVADEGE